MRPHGLRTVIYPVAELEPATAWWAGMLDNEPYFKEPFYVGFDVAGDELGLVPAGDAPSGAHVYWGVDDVQAAVDEALAHGATLVEPPTDVGGDIVTALVRTPHDALLGLIFNPNHPG